MTSSSVSSRAALPDTSSVRDRGERHPQRGRAHLVALARIGGGEVGLEAGLAVSSSVWSVMGASIARAAPAPVRP